MIGMTKSKATITLDRALAEDAPKRLDNYYAALAELDAEKFKDRERAAGELEKEGVAVTAALRKALEGNPPAEARRRIGMLLAKLEGPGVNLGVLAVPEGVRVLGPDDLLARNREGLKSANVRVRGEVATLMTRFGPDPAAWHRPLPCNQTGCPAGSHHRNLLARPNKPARASESAHSHPPW